MKSVPKLIRSFVGILLLSSVLILVINLVVFAIFMVKLSPNTAASPYNIATETAKALKSTNNGYALSEEVSVKLKANDVWAILIDNDTAQVVWKTENVPDSVPSAYTLSDIANLVIGHIDGYPTYTSENENGVVVLGFPKDSFWKHIRPTWNYSLIANFADHLKGATNQYCSYPCNLHGSQYETPKVS